MCVFPFVLRQRMDVPSVEASTCLDAANSISARLLWDTKTSTRWCARERRGNGRHRDILPSMPDGWYPRITNNGLVPPR
jgi:hypothetical protein